jgi:hypothetical protein
MSYQITENDVRDYLMNNYRKITQLAAKCVILQIIITQEAREGGFKNKRDALEAVDSCAFMYSDMSARF